jgi:cytochrome b561/polyisoprenoid-binding protein YceI
MAYSNSAQHFGSVTKTLHWLTAALIFTAFPLGLIANNWGFASSDELATKATLFSAHKTLGVALFFVALARITWAAFQPHPAGLHPERRAETMLATLIHWLLYLSLVIVPLSGWVHHAATTGFAPIWWPFGQSLPFVPVSEPLAVAAAAMHWVFTKMLAASLLLHIAGALKHHFIDRDAVLLRMLPGRPALPDIASVKPQGRGPMIAALAIYVAGALIAYTVVQPAENLPQQALIAPPSEWQVQTGTLALSVTQLGTSVSGQFNDWTAAIVFSDTPTQDRYGSVAVTIALDSIALGSVSAQATGPQFFNTALHPTAEFTADLLAADSGYVAQGTLALSGVVVPVIMPFSLDLQGDTATMIGEISLDRRDFGLGSSYSDESSVGFNVNITVTLTASRAP